MFLKFKCFSRSLFIGMLACFLSSSTAHAVWQQPPHEFAPARYYPIAVASDASGHAFALVNTDSPRAMLASFYSSGVWEDPGTVIGPQAPASVDIAMDNGGTALAIWCELFTGNIRTAYFDGSTWSTPSPDPLDTGVSVGFLSVAMNGPNTGVAMWIDFNTGNVRSSFFSSGTWSAYTVIGTGSFNTSIAYSSNGTAVAGWFDFPTGGTKVNNYTGGSWQGEIVFDPAGQEAAVGIDSTGKALAVWSDAAANIATSTFNGISWSPSQVIYTPSLAAFSPQIGMTPNGTAVAAWIDNGALFSSSYNGAVWSAPIQITAGPIGGYFGLYFSLSVADNGNALAVWATSTEIRSARLPLGGVWSPEELVATLVLEFGEDRVHIVDSSLSEDGTAFAAWGTDTEGGEFQFASVELASVVLPPTNLQGFTCTNKFASQSDRVNTLTWTPSTDPSVVGYNLRRNGVLIATIPVASLPFYQDHNRCKNVVDVYTLTAFDASGLESTPISISIL